MEKERREALEWFVQFANMNLNDLKLGDKAKLVVESQEYLFPTKELEDLPPYRLMGGDLRRFTKEMSWAFKEPPQRDSEEYWSLILHLQAALEHTLSLLAPKYHPLPKGVIDLSGGVAPEKIWAATVMVRSGGNLKNFSFSYVPLADSHADYIEIKLNLLLNGLPRSTLKSCPGPIRIGKGKFEACGKFFLNFSRRNKRFCSPRCMWRFNTAKRRAADPEGYNEYQNILMKDRRREKGGHRRLKTKSRKVKKGG
jgi:hypothetical protein